MRLLQQSQTAPRLSDVQPGLPVLRGQTDSADRDIAYPSLTNFLAQIRGVERLGGSRSQREGHQGSGQRPRGYWPGFSHGVRPPTVDETPLSLEEVEHGLLRGCL